MRRITPVFLAVLLLSACPASLSARIIDIPDDEETIQAGIDAADDGDTVLVAPGRYNENITFDGNAITVASLLLTTGEEGYIDSTVIDAGENGRSVVVVRQGEGDDSILDGFTITGGETDYGGGVYVRDSSPTLRRLLIVGNSVERNGAGIYCTRGAAPLVQDCVLRDNTAGLSGGGVACYDDASPTLQRVHIHRNEADLQGGGVQCLESPATFVDCLIDSNRVNTYGGGLFSGGIREVSLENCRLIGNSAERGGGVYINSPLTATGCVIIGNSAVATGGGVRTAEDGELTLQNCTVLDNDADNGGGFYLLTGSFNLTYTLIAGNEAESGGGGIYSIAEELALENVTLADNAAETGAGIYQLQEGSLAVVNCILWENDDAGLVTRPQAGECTVSIRYSDINGGGEGVDLQEGDELEWGEGNINDDPLFADPDGDDYRLTADSPCIDAGDPDSPRDPDGSHADMGALPVLRSGRLEGRVTIAASGEALAGALVFTAYGDTTRTDEQGGYAFPYAWTAEPFDLTASHPGYVDSTVAAVELDEGDTLEVDFGLQRPLPELEPRSFEFTLDYGDSTVAGMNLVNAGDYPLAWSSEWYEHGHDPLDSLLSFHAGAAADDRALQGAAFVDGRFFVTGGEHDTNWVYIFDRSGELLDRFRQFGDTRLGMRDLTWDGENLWGVEGSAVYRFTTDGELVDHWRGPEQGNQAIAWDPDRGLLWICSITSYIYGYDRDGNRVTDADNFDLYIYGLAYLPDDPDGRPLYILHDPNLERRQAVHKMDPEEEDTLFVFEPVMGNGGYPAGLEFSADFERGSTVMVVCSNNFDDDRVDIWMLQPGPSWLFYSPSEGELAAGDSVALELSISAAQRDPGRYAGELRFTFPVVAGSAVVPVSLEIEPLTASPPSVAPVTDFTLTLHPNPFNAVLTVAYTLPQPMDASIGVYDITGRRVASFAREWRPSGRYRTTLNASGWGSGVYFIRLETARERITRKVVCVK